MLIGRFAVQCRPEYADAMAEALVAVETPSRAIPGVVHFDVARSLTDPNAFVVTEVFAHHAAFEQQNEHD
jgi:quinol monooxygenase YgiN